MIFRKLLAPAAVALVALPGCVRPDPVPAWAVAVTALRAWNGAAPGLAFGPGHLAAGDAVRAALTARLGDRPAIAVTIEPFGGPGRCRPVATVVPTGDPPDDPGPHKVVLCVHTDDLTGCPPGPAVVSGRVEAVRVGVFTGSGEDGGGRRALVVTVRLSDARAEPR